MLTTVLRGDIRNKSAKEQRRKVDRKSAARHSPGGTDGANPNGGLVIGTKGAIYGTTSTRWLRKRCPHHSGQGCGTAFQADANRRRAAAWGGGVSYIVSRQLLTVVSPAAGRDLRRRGPNSTALRREEAGATPQALYSSSSHNANGSWTEHILYSFQDGNDGAAAPRQRRLEHRR